MPEPILVVGAGIGGLTAALAFAKAGYTVAVFERAARLEEAGAGLQLSPNALRVLGQLGLDPADLRGVAADSVTLRAGRSGRPIVKVPVLAADGTAYLSLHRADLQAALLAAVARESRITLSLGMECTGLRRDGDGFVLTFRGKEAVEQRTTILVAADGVGSTVARLIGHPPARPSGDVAWRMTVTHPSASASEASPGITAWLGPSRHAVAYPIRNGTETNLVLIGPAADAGGDATGPVDKEALLTRFGGWDPRIRQLVAEAGPATAWPMSTRAAVTQGAPGLFLIGDAAHAMLPYAAQGAAMAIEDAWEAAHAVATTANAADAGRLFAERRAPRIAKVLKRVAFHRRVYHLPLPFSLARDLVLRSRSKAALGRDLAWLYDWIPPTL